MSEGAFLASQVAVAFGLIVTGAAMIARHNSLVVAGVCAVTAAFILSL